jgi:hypothetical protein
MTLFEEILEEVAGGWADEIFADLVAARLVGPPFLVALDRITLGEVAAQEDDELSTHPSDGLRFEVVARYLKEKLPHIYDDRVWRDLLQKRSTSGQTELLPRFAREVCNRCVSRFAVILDQVRSPLTDKIALAKRLRAIRQLLGDLAPPSAACMVTSKEDVADAFWLLFYAAWHFRLDNRSFAAFRKRYHWTPNERLYVKADRRARAEMENEEELKAEAAIGSLILHSLQSLELQLLWNTENGSGSNATQS